MPSHEYIIATIIMWVASNPQTERYLAPIHPDQVGAGETDPTTSFDPATDFSYSTVFIILMDDCKASSICCATHTPFIAK